MNKVLQVFALIKYGSAGVEVKYWNDEGLEAAGIQF